jgi:phenylacetyl-CoA:acceptor oxidoreductase subunit 1
MPRKRILENPRMATSIINEQLNKMEANDQTRWGMVVDINRCVGCQTCTIACKHTNDTVPGVQWRKVLDVETGSYPDVERVFLVTGCQHCAEPSCVPVCPTGATKQRDDGLVTMDYDLCIGCASCAVACPYQARTIVHDKESYFAEETIQEKKVAHDERFGVAQKCTFCVDRLDEGLAKGLTPGEDWEATPACSASCIASAITFGDFNDPNSKVSKLTQDQPFMQINEELGNDPQIKYLYETPSVPGRDVSSDELETDLFNDENSPLAGEIQTYWDWRAAMNFIMGGIGAGLTAFAGLYFYLFENNGIILQSSLSIGVFFICCGLFFVWLKIGRKLRALYVLFRPQTSWMSREVYAVSSLFLLIGISFIYELPALGTLIFLFAVLFLYCQTKILQASKGISSWRQKEIPILLLAIGLYEGLALFSLIVYFGDKLVFYDMSVSLLVILGATNTFILARYSRKVSSKVNPSSRKILSKAIPKLQVLGFIIPSVILAIYMMLEIFTSLPYLLGLVLIIINCVYFKFILIVKAGHQQGFILPKLPQRGSGNMAASAIST